MSPRMSVILASRSAPAILNPVFVNTLTRLIPDLYAGLDLVSRELVGMIPSVQRSVSAERAAVNESIVYTVSPQLTAYDIVPAMTVPEPPDVVVGNGTMTISKARAVPFGFTGEEQKGLNNGPGYISLQADFFAQALRTLTNEIETDLALTASLAASRAVGVAGTTPFSGGSFGELADLRKILDDNGAPLSGRSFVMNTTAGASMRKINNLIKVNEAGTQMTLRQGELLDLYGFAVKESAQTPYHVKGTASGATTSGAAVLPVGTTTIPTAAAGTGTILDGDVVTFAGDTNKYVVAVGGGNGNVANAGSIKIAAPGLRQPIPAAATAITVSGSFSANVGFSANAMVWAARAPALPEEGDAAVDSMMITDPRSGVTFEIRIYAVYRKIRAEVGLAWGFKAVKPEHIGLVLG